MYAYRMLDTAYADIARLFDSWRQAPQQVGAILGREVVEAAAPIEARQMKSIGDCQAAWVIAWSASREQFTGAPGPLHTRSKRFASLKNSPAKIGDMLREIGDYEELSANRDSLWQQDAADATAWLDDYARVCEEAHSDAADDRILPPPEEEGALAAEEEYDDGGPALALVPVSVTVAEQLAASAVSLPPSYLAVARQAQDRGSWAARSMAACSLPVRLAVYLKLLGACDDSYPSEWLDAATGELPTMQQLATLDGLSLPTLRKRRDLAIALLQAPRADELMRKAR
jgi:hypothetical protein